MGNDESSDRELLELAAKAGGVGPLDFDYAEREGHGFYMGPRLPMPQGVLMAAMWTYWNPRDDDGDSRRLEAALDITVTPGDVKCRAQWWVRPDMIELGSVVVLTGEDKAAAVRLVVLLAAAEIGRVMP